MSEVGVGKERRRTTAGGNARAMLLLWGACQAVEPRIP